MASRSRLHLSFPHLSAFIFVLSFTHGHPFGEPMEVKANKLTCNKTKLSYPYYSIPYCRPHNLVNSYGNLDEITRGDRLQNSLYEFQMGFNMMCDIVCRITLNKKTTKEFKEKIDEGYRANMVLDHLPLRVPVTRTDDDFQAEYQLGYFVGGKVRHEDTQDEKYFINNHLSFIVSYHQDEETYSKRIVGFEAKAFSINHKYDDPCCVKIPLTMCDLHANHVVKNSDPIQEVDDKKDIFFTYDVEFRKSDVKWASRWDTYNLLITDDQIPWFTIVNSLMNVLLISSMVAGAMLGTLYRCISDYNQLETLEEGQEESGSKLVHTDAFRVNPELLCVYVGYGVQVFGMIVVTIIFGLLGFLSPSTTGGLMIDVIFLWALMGILSGFAMACLYKTFEGPNWIKTASVFTGLVFCVLFIINVVRWSEGSWVVIPLRNFFVLTVLWFSLSVPLVFIGSYIGFKQPRIKDPVKNNEIPREIPDQHWYKSPSFAIMIGGIIPSGAVFNEFFFTIGLIGLPQFYYMFGLVIVVLIIICVEVTIFKCYLHLCREDYRWWWRSYLTSSSLAFYFFIYTAFYFFTKLNITELVPIIIYFGYVLIGSLAFFMLTGMIGFYTCLWFTRLIYSSVKIV